CTARVARARQPHLPDRGHRGRRGRILRRRGARDGAQDLRRNPSRRARQPGALGHVRRPRGERFRPRFFPDPQERLLLPQGRMKGRDVLLIAHGSLHPALRRELAARGLTLRESAGWQDADRSEPGRILGAYTWMYEGLRHPLTVWRMHRELRREGIPLFVWNQDAPHYLNRAAWRLDWLDRARLYDIYATHTLLQSRRPFCGLVRALSD